MRTLYCVLVLAAAGCGTDAEPVPEPQTIAGLWQSIEDDPAQGVQYKIDEERICLYFLDKLDTGDYVNACTCDRLTKVGDNYNLAAERKWAKPGYFLTVHDDNLLFCWDAGCHSGYMMRRIDSVRDEYKDLVCN